MAEVLRDPIWQFIGAVIALLAFIVSIYIFVLQKKKKSLCYEIVTDVDLLTVNEEIKGKLKILFSDVPIENASLIILKVKNDGSLPIASTDFERSLTFFFGNTSILSGEIIERIPDALKPELSIHSNHIQLEPMLLNSGDSITIKLLVAQYDRTIEPDTRIVGVSHVRQVERKVDKTLILPLAIFIFFLGSVGFVIFVSVFEMGEKFGLSRPLSMLFAAIICLLNISVLMITKPPPWRNP